ncbi:hypothetical protein V6N11_019065 [Hibiscus sabdariffa]|uniref:Uncharacterized protein n=1 Tax=Hibiscus sabdariffa TaxID=183260 RepID=A0ABR2R1A9_9ROSI
MCEKLSESDDIFKIKVLKQKGSGAFPDNITSNDKVVLGNNGDGVTKVSVFDNSSSSSLVPMVQSPVVSEECIAASH